MEFLPPPPPLRGSYHPPRMKKFNKLTSFQSINVLCVHSQQQSLVVQKLYKVVHIVWLVISWIQALCQAEKWSWIIPKEVQVKNSCWFWDFVLL